MLRFSRFQVGGERFEFLGFEFRWGKNRKGNPQIWRTTAKKKLKAAIANFTVWIKALLRNNDTVAKVLEVTHS